MKKLLGNKYGSFLEPFETVNPVTREGNHLFSSGCLIPAYTHLESAIAVDLVNETVHAAIFRQDEKTRYFNEGGKATPEVIRAWANKLRQLNSGTSSSQSAPNHIRPTSDRFSFTPGFSRVIANRRMGKPFKRFPGP